MSPQSVERKREYNREYRERNRDRLREYQRQYVRRTPQTAADRRLARYGLAAERYESMLAAQGGACAICRAEFGSTPHVDHDHSCCPVAGRSCGKCVRGLLCNVCNWRLGWFETNAAAVLAYLDDWSAK